MRNITMPYNRRTMLLKAAALIIVIFFAAVVSPGCAGARQRYMFSLNFACIYDNHTGLFVNASQEYKYSEKTFISIKNTKPVYKQGIVKDYSIPAEYTKSGSEIKFTVGYIIEDGKLCIAPPLLYGSPFISVYVLPDEKSAVFVFNQADVFIINVTEDKISPVFDEKDFTSVSSPDAALVWVDIVSISPDGKYILYKSNRNNFSSDAKNFDLFAKDLVSGENKFVMNFNKKDFISWNKEQEGSFLYREDISESIMAEKKYSEIFTYSLDKNENGVFWNMKDKFRGYEPIDETFFYLHMSDRLLNIVNYYNKDLIIAETGMYSIIKDLKLSPDNGYAAMYGSHTNVDGKLITEVISIHLETNSMISHTEDSVKTFIVDSYHFGKRTDNSNVLVINYLDTGNLTYKSEFYIINHKYAAPDSKQTIGNADE